MSEYAVHQHVSELLNHFEIVTKTSDTTSLSASGYAELLLKSRTPNVSAPAQGLASVKILAESSPSPNNELLMQKYERIHMKNRRELDATVTLLANISKNSSVKHFLKRNAEHRAKTVAAMQGHGTSSMAEYSVFEKHESKEKSSGAEGRSGPSLCFQEGENTSLSWDFEPPDKRDNIGDIGTLPMNVQESKLIDDLLFCLGGINGEYIYSLPNFDGSGMRQFVVDPTCDPSFQELTKRILPICAYYSTIVRFIEEYSLFEHGLVNQALAAAMRHLLKDYYILIAQLELQFTKFALSLQKMWFYLQPTKKNMEMLSQVCERVIQGSCHGGTVLTVLHEIVTTQTGDSKMQDLLIYLLKASCTPYFDILEKWIYKGKIADPYLEFFVMDNETDKQKESSFNSDEYWEKKYTICRKKIPLFLEKVADIILRTGKYLNVIQQCGHDVSCPSAEKMAYNIEERQYIEQTEKAYNFASKTLLNMLIEDSDLIGRLRSLKHYFLMDQGDFIVQFMDMAEEELNKEVDDIIPTKLEFLLELALRTSVVNSDKYKDDVGVQILEFDLSSQMIKLINIGNRLEYFQPAKNMDFAMSGVEAFSFRYNIKWPLSLVINQYNNLCYQMLFRHLFYCKYVERVLGNVWSMNKVAKSYSLDSSRGYASAFALRQQMLSFIQALQYYMNFEILEPSWHTMITKIQEVADVDQLLEIHNKFLDDSLKDCMLWYPNLHCTLIKLLKLCTSFAHFMKKTHRGAVEAELSLIGTASVMGLGEKTSAPSSLTIIGDDEEQQLAGGAAATTMDVPLSFREKIAEYHADFNKTLFELLKRITAHDKEHSSDKLVNMWYRLDFNGFYVNELQTQSMCG